jgi:photosystem II stability/assembly factor-like uncharacterized protein
MICSKYISVLFLFAFLNMNAQQWELCTSPVTVPLNDIYFYDLNKGWIAGNKGVILSTTNGGSDWSVKSTNTAYNLSSIYFNDLSKGWATGANGTILYSTDEGNTWQYQNDVTNIHIFKIQFCNTNTGFMVGGTMFDGIIFKTQDGGLKWTNITPSNINGTYRALYFINEREGWVVGGKSTIDNFEPNLIMHTMDGGNTWDELSNRIVGPLYGIHFFNPQLGWAYGDSPLGFGPIKTTDGGKTWDTKRLQKGELAYTDIYTSFGFTDSLNMWIAGTVVDTIYCTTNGGITWTASQMPKYVNFYSITFKKNKQGYAVGGGGSIFRYNGSTGIVKKENTVDDFSISNNYPNPFNPATTISYSVPADGKVVVKVFDVLGRELSTLVNETVTAGKYSVAWNGNNIASGVYFYSVTFKNQTLYKKMLLVK